MTDSQQLPLFMTKEGKNLGRHTQLVDLVIPFQEYLRSEGKAQNTIKGFSSDLHLMCQFFGDDKPLYSITTSDLNKFLYWLENGRGRPCSRKSYARRVTTIKVLFKWLQDKKIRLENPSKSIVQRSGPAPLSPIVSPDDLNRMQDFARELMLDDEKPDARPAFLVRLLLETGIKKSEAKNLLLSDIDRESDNPTIHIRYKSKRNIYKERRIPVSKDLMRLLGAYIKQYKVKDAIFTCTPRNLEYVLNDLAVNSGVQGKVSFEILRWTCAVRDYLNGADLDDLRRKMGLSPISWRETSNKIKKLATIQTRK